MGRSERVTAALRASGWRYSGVPIPSLGVGTHLEALAWAATQAGPGPVVEFGSGVFSTPWLHGFCEGSGRDLLSVETDPVWLKINRGLYAADFHRWTDLAAPPDYDCALVFVDGGSRATWQRQRLEWIEPFDGTGAIVVVHDTPDKRCLEVGAALAGFANVRIFDRVRPATTVAWS